MTKNKLEVNKPRIGWYFDNQPEEGSPLTAALLENDGGQITLRVPIHPGQDTGPVARWFYGNGVHFADDPDRTRHSYSPPESLVFRDPDGAVLLLGCRSMGIRSQIPGTSEGKIRAQYAVIGAETADFSSPNQMRTYIPGMGSWTKISSIRMSHTIDKDGRATHFEMNAKEIEPIELAPGIILATSWSSTGQGEDNQREMSDPPFIQTTFEDSASMQEHLIVHTRFRELVDLAFWKPTGYKRIQSRLYSDSMYGQKKWREIKTYSLRSQEKAHKGMPMFHFNDVGPEAYRLWVDSHKKYERAINPLMSLVDIQDVNVEAQFIQSCIGLEGLGVQIGRDAGSSKREILSVNLQRVVDNIGFTLSPDWAERTANKYNDMKHYDRDQAIDSLDIYNNLLENELVFRAWATLRIGLEKQKVLRGLETSSAGQQLLQQKIIKIPESSADS